MPFAKKKRSTPLQQVLDRQGNIQYLAPVILYSFSRSDETCAVPMGSLHKCSGGWPFATHYLRWANLRQEMRSLGLLAIRSARVFMLPVARAHARHFLGCGFRCRNRPRLTGGAPAPDRSALLCLTREPGALLSGVMCYDS